MKEELLKLAKRVEALSGPDRDVDLDICIALDTGRSTDPRNPGPMRYTASLDAAMTLVPGGENGRWNAGKFNADPNKCSAQVAIEDEIFIESGSLGRGLKVRASGTARTPALALCAAALRALAKDK